MRKLKLIIFSLFNRNALEPLKGNSKLRKVGANTLSSEIAKRQKLYNTMVINDNIVSLKGNILLSGVKSIIKKKAIHLISNKAQYKKIASYFHNNISWFIVGIIHEMEAEQNFTKYLGNGQSLYKKTTIVPKGRGPFSSFNAGAIDALKLDGADKITDWSMGNILYFLEEFNGYGYSLYKGINSPYIWSGSNQYLAGKYISDNVYDKNAVSLQIGCALLIKQLDMLGEL